MQKETLTKYLITELHRLVDANAQTLAVTRAMRTKATNHILQQTLETQKLITEGERRLLDWLLAETGERLTSTPARAVEIMAMDGWAATAEKDSKLRDLEIATASTQLQSYHLATWFGIASWLRVLNLHTEADVVDRLTHELRRLEYELETLRPTLAQLKENQESKDWYRPSVRRHHGNIFKSGL